MAAEEARVRAARAAQRKVFITVLQRGGGRSLCAASRPLLQDRPVPGTGLADAGEVLGTHLEHAGPVRRPDLPDRGVLKRPIWPTIALLWPPVCSTVERLA